MKANTLRATRAHLTRAALALVFATVLSASLVPSALAAPPSKSPDQTPKGPIAVGLDTTPGDATYLYKITEPGSYYLAGNVVGVEGKAGVGIFAGGVTLNLNGMSVIGTTNSSAGIFVSNAFAPVRIHNGRVFNWDNYGILVTNSSVELESVSSSDNRLSGFLITDASTATLNRCFAEDNGEIGFQIGGLMAVVSDSIARNNGFQGFYVLRGTVRNSGAYSNGTVGIDVNYGTVVDSVSDRNAGIGIRILGGEITRCSVSENTGPAGIRVSSQSFVSGNLVSRHLQAGQAGILVAGQNNRIEDNNTVSNTIGLSATSSGNLIVRNTARGNTWNYEIVTGNRVGTISVPPVSGAISGNSGAAGSGTTDPWSNLAY